MIRLNLTRSISTALDLGIANPPVSPAIFPWNTNAVIRNKQGRKVFVPYLQYLPTVSPITPMITHAVALNTVDRLKICSVLYDPLKMFTAGVAVSKYVSVSAVYSYYDSCLFRSLNTIIIVLFWLMEAAIIT